MIKGGFQELYVGKTKSDLITIMGNRKQIIYEDLSSINYCLSHVGIRSGYVNFNGKDGKTIRFEFGFRANEKIRKTAALIEENNLELDIRELQANDIRFWQTDWFMLIMSWACCLPIGLFLLWYYKKFNRVARVFITIILVCWWGYNLYGIGSAYNSTMQAINDIRDVMIGNSAESASISPTASEKATETLETESYSTTLIPGYYLVGTDIPSGTYDFFSKRGMGNLLSSDGSVNVIFDHDGEMGKDTGMDGFGTEELKGIRLDDGVTLSVSGAQEVSAGCNDGEVKSMKKRNQENVSKKELGYGHYGVPDDIQPGTYDVTLVEGAGNIICDSSADGGGINEIMGKAHLGNKMEENTYITKFKNLTLEEGDILEIDDIKIKLTPSK